jgi:glycosyltransferase involved in cell wall biosynthesis
MIDKAESRTEANIGAAAGQKPNLTSASRAVVPAPLVTVCCATFNHAGFIREAMEGFLMQRTDFAVEMVVFDDCSTDETRSILADYQQKYPHSISLVFPERNQRSQGITWMQTLLPTARGKFIALCEGDDRWTDPLKLQRQADYLRERDDLAGCFHRTKLVDEKGDVIQEDFFIPDRKEYDFHACLSLLGKQYATCSMMIRAETVRQPPPWLQRRFIDMFLELQVARHGKIGFIDENMADYRRHSRGVWSSLKTKDHVLELVHRYRLLLEDREMNVLYGPEIRRRMNQFADMLVLRSDYEEIKDKLEELRRVVDRKGSFLRRCFSLLVATSK